MSKIFYSSISLVAFFCLITRELVLCVPTSGDQETVLQGFRDVVYEYYDEEDSSSDSNAISTGSRKGRSVDYTLGMDFLESRYKRNIHSSQELEDLVYTVLDHINHYREKKGFGHLELDDALTEQSQLYATQQVQTFPRVVTHSCDPCTQYSEINLRRRSSNPLPKGIEGGDWIFEHLYPNDDENDYDLVVLDPENHKIGVGAGYATDQKGINYIYVVLRFSSD